MPRYRGPPAISKDNPPCCRRHQWTGEMNHNTTQYQPLATKHVATNFVTLLNELTISFFFAIITSGIVPQKIIILIFEMKLFK